jgi:phage baseplate assembly protein W
MRNGFTVSFPLQIDREDSDYILVDTIPELVRQNLKNLILTSPGERIMDPEFGVGIKRFLFENKTVATTNTIRSALTVQINRYMPFVSIVSIDFVDDEQEPNLLGIAITYFIAPTSTTDQLRLSFNLLTQTLTR